VGLHLSEFAAIATVYSITIHVEEVTGKKRQRLLALAARGLGEQVHSIRSRKKTQGRALSC